MGVTVQSLAMAAQVALDGSGLMVQTAWVPPTTLGPLVTMTAGTATFGNHGYASSAFASFWFSSSAFGSISATPLTGATWVGLGDGDSTVLAFSGDHSSELTGKSLYINGTPYALTNIMYDGTYTTAELTGSPTFSNGVTYNIQLG